MNQASWKAALFALLFSIAGCTAYMSSLQSTFFSRFSLRELVARNKTHASLNCSGGGGGGGIAMGTGGVGRRQSNFHKGESLSCQVRDAEQFDEETFIRGLKQTVETDLRESKAKIVSSRDLDAISFRFEYTFGDITGNIEVSGRKFPGNYYSLKADLEEKKGDEK